MVDLLPSRPDTSAVDDPDPLVVGVDSEAAADLLAALRSDTGRAILDALYEDPACASALADRTGTSVQNVQYHIEKLLAADLVSVVDTVYSEKGREMKVYGPTARPLVVYAGSDEQTTGLEAAVKRLVGSAGVLAVASLVVDRVVAPLSTGPEFPSDGSVGQEDGDVHLGANATGTPTPSPRAETDAPARTATETAADAATSTPVPTDAVVPATDTATAFTDAAATAPDAASSLAQSPGLVFFLGGLAVLLAGFVAWYARQ